jgi:hypothetical protein
VDTIRIRLGHESLDATLAYLKGKDAESEEAQEYARSSLALLGIKAENIITGDFWPTKAEISRFRLVLAAVVTCLRAQNLTIRSEPMGLKILVAGSWEVYYGTTD